MQLPDGFEGLVAIMDRLRGPDGCPWDREQDYHTLRGYLLEECHEVAEALDAADHAGLCEELGDLLFQIVFLSRIAKEERRFTVDDVIEGITAKMIRRHPHVFADDSAETSEDVLRKWEAIKREEKKGKATGEVARSVLDGVPRSLPSLLKAQRLGTKASRVGFDWSAADEVLGKVDEELAELRQAVAAADRDAMRDELGDLLFSIANLGRHIDVEPEAALERANRKFTGRFHWLEKELKSRGVEFDEVDLAELERLWQQAKGQPT